MHSDVEHFFLHKSLNNVLLTSGISHSSVAYIFSFVELVKAQKQETIAALDTIFIS